MCDEAVYGYLRRSVRRGIVLSCDSEESGRKEIDGNGIDVEVANRIMRPIWKLGLRDTYCSLSLALVTTYA